MKTHHIIYAATLIALAFFAFIFCKLQPTPPPDTNSQYIADSIRIDDLNNLLSFKDSLLQLNKHTDTVIVTKWRTRIDSIPYTTDAEVVMLYDSITNDSVTYTDGRFGFNRSQIDTITTKLYEGEQCAEQLENCQEGMQIQDEMRGIQDSIIVLQRDQNKQLREIIYVNEETFQRELKRMRRRSVVFGIGGGVVGVLVGIIAH